jgi:DNA repair protein RadC
MREEFVTLRTEVLKQRDVDSASTIADLCRDWGLADGVQESFWVVAYDAALNVRTVTEIAKGSYTDVEVSIPAVLSAVLMSGTDRFVVVHNHPSGTLSPTSLDMRLTKAIMDAADVVGLYFEDHIIVGPGGSYYSLTEHGRLVPSQKLAKEAMLRARAGTRHRFLQVFHHMSPLTPHESTSTVRALDHSQEA